MTGTSMDAWSPVSSSAGHSLHVRVITKVEGVCSPNHSDTPRTSNSTPRTSISTQSYEDEYRDSLSRSSSIQSEANWQRLTRVEAVRDQYLKHKHIIHVYLKSTHLPVYQRDPNYTLEMTDSYLESVHETMLRTSRRHKKACSSCKTRIRFLRDANPHTVSRLLSSSHDREEDLERYLHGLLRLCAVVQESYNVGDCNGCDVVFHTLAKFFRRQYTPSSGLI